MMKKISLLLVIIAALASCTGKQQQESSEAETPLKQYADSIVKVYPNYDGNIAVSNKICDDFKKHLDTLPGILEGTEFKFIGAEQLRDIDRNYIHAGFTCSEPSLLVICADFDPDAAVALVKDNHYKITGGTVDKYSPNDIANPWLDFGVIEVKNLTVEEVK